MKSIFILGQLLSLEQYSGHVVPTSAFEVHCSLEDGKIISKISKDISSGTWGQVILNDTTLSTSELNQVQTWIVEASAGPFKQAPNPCDIGTYRVLTETYPLINSQDCGKRVTNLHPSAKKIIDWFQKACGLEGRK